MKLGCAYGNQTCPLFYIRQFQHLLRTVPAGVDQGWRHGTVHYSDDSLRYYRLTSLKPGPNVTFARQGMEISGRRAPEGTETDILDGMLILQVQTAGRAEDDYELAMGPGAVTAFQSWLESRQSARSQRRGRRRHCATGRRAGR